jgi:CheY-like chemotaxis protein
MGLKHPNQGSFFIRQKLLLLLFSIKHMPPKPSYILLADDDPDDQMTFTEAFGQRHPDITVVCVNDGEQLLEYLESCTDMPMFILMDYKMPIVTAPVVLGRLASRARFSEIAKLVWSTSSRKDHVEECLSLGAKHYFAKPCGNRDLEEMIDKIANSIAN